MTMIRPSLVPLRTAMAPAPAPATDTDTDKQTDRDSKTPTLHQQIHQEAAGTNAQSGRSSAARRSCGGRLMPASRMLALLIHMRALACPVDPNRQGMLEVETVLKRAGRLTRHQTLEVQERDAPLVPGSGLAWRPVVKAAF